MKINNNHFKEYKKKGWLVLKSFLNKQEIKNAKKKIKYFLSKNIKNYSGRDINFARENRKFSEINSFHQLHDSKWIKNFSKRKKINNLVEKFLNNKEPELRASEYFAKPKKIGLHVPVHQDNFYWNVKGNSGLTIWIALSKVSKKNGALFYYDGSHKKGIFAHKKSFAKGSSQMLKNINILKKFKKSYTTLAVGDVLIHHCLVLHGSDPNKSDLSRKGWTFQFKAKSAKYDSKKISKYEKQLNEQIKK
tara:strand:+ start:59 stop:802 length:744 start_codon:yes stop_codon:yes gene_type:complete